MPAVLIVVVDVFQLVIIKGAWNHSSVHEAVGFAHRRVVGSRNQLRVDLGEGARFAG